MDSRSRYQETKGTLDSMSPVYPAAWHLFLGNIEQANT